MWGSRYFIRRITSIDEDITESSGSLLVADIQKQIDKNIDYSNGEISTINIVN